MHTHTHAHTNTHTHTYIYIKGEKEVRVKDCHECECEARERQTNFQIQINWDPKASRQGANWRHSQSHFVQANIKSKHFFHLIVLVCFKWLDLNNTCKNGWPAFKGRNGEFASICCELTSMVTFFKISKGRWANLGSSVFLIFSLTDAAH